MTDDRTTIMLLDDLHAITDELERRFTRTAGLEAVAEAAQELCAPLPAFDVLAAGKKRWHKLKGTLDRLKGDAMAGARIQPYRDEGGDYRWRRIAENGNIIADSGEGYANKRDCLNMARANFPDDPFDWSRMPDPDALIDDGDDDEDEANL